MSARLEKKTELRVKAPLASDSISHELGEVRTVQLAVAVTAQVEDASEIHEGAGPRDCDPESVSDPVSSDEAETLSRMIAEAAYYKAEQRGFEPGHEAEDWVAAEKEVLARLGA